MDIMTREAVEVIRDKYVGAGYYSENLERVINQSFDEYGDYIDWLHEFLPSRRHKRILISNYPNEGVLTVPYIILVVTNRIVFRCWKLFQSYLSGLFHLEDENAVSSFRSFLENIGVLSYISLNLENGVSKIADAQEGGNVDIVAIDVMESELNNITNILLGTRIRDLLDDPKKKLVQSINAKTMVEKYGAILDKRHVDACIAAHVAEGNQQPSPQRSIEKIYSDLCEVMHPNAISVMFDNSTEGEIRPDRVDFALNEYHRIEMLYGCIRDYPRFIYLFTSVVDGIHDMLRNTFAPECQYQFEEYE